MAEVKTAPLLLTGVGGEAKEEEGGKEAEVVGQSATKLSAAQPSKGNLK